MPKKNLRGFCAVYVVDLDLFYGKVKFGHLGFCIGKRQDCGFI